MAFAEWNDRYLTGIRQVDDQHRALFDAVNKLHAAMKEGKGRDAMNPLLDFLVRYAKEHFATEEGLMRAAGYKDYPAHKALHDQFIIKVADFATKFQKGQALVTLDLLKFLFDWLTTHILEQDVTFGKAVGGAKK